MSGHALRVMKKIDRVVLGPAAKYLWPEMRKKRYQLMNPASAAYMLVPHMNLSPEIRQRVIMEEMAEGRQGWSDMAASASPPARGAWIETCSGRPAGSHPRSPPARTATSATDITRYRSAGGAICRPIRVIRWFGDFPLMWSYFRLADRSHTC